MDDFFVESDLTEPEHCRTPDHCPIQGNVRLIFPSSLNSILNLKFHEFFNVEFIQKFYFWDNGCGQLNEPPLLPETGDTFEVCFNRSLNFNINFQLPMFKDLFHTHTTKRHRSQLVSIATNLQFNLPWHSLRLKNSRNRRNPNRI